MATLQGILMMAGAGLAFGLLFYTIGYLLFLWIQRRSRQKGVQEAEREAE